MDIQRRLAKPRTIVVIAIALIVVLILLFQKEERLSKLFDQVNPDHLSVLYLQLLLEMNPNKSELRIALASQLSKLGQLDNAYKMLEPLLMKKGADAIRARLLSLDIDIKKYFAIEPLNPSREPELLKLQEKMVAIVNENLPSDTLPEAIKMSLGLNLPEIAAKLYVTRASVDVDNHSVWIKEAGRWYIASGNPLQASQLFKSAFDTASEPDLARDYALLSITALRAADKAEKALEFVEQYLVRFPQDPSLLDTAIALALEVNKPNQAVRWGALRLALSIEDPVQIEKQVNLAVTASDLSLALQLSERLMQLKPEDEKIRLRTAQIAEWSGKRQKALTQWLWLSRNKGDETSINNALRLAKGLYQGEAIIEMLNLKSQLLSLTQPEIYQLLQAYGQANPKQLVEIIAHYLVRHPSDSFTWEVLAKLQTDSGQMDAAISTWQQINTRFGSSSENVTQLAKLLWRQWKPDDAFSTLANHMDRATDQDYEFWTLLGNLAWQLENSKTAYQAYKILWKSDSPDELIAARLIHLSRDMKQFSEAAFLSEQSYWKFKQPRWLMLAMDSTLHARKWEELERLVNISIDNKEQFVKQEPYWLMRAQLANHKQQLEHAQTYYSRALAINPQSVAGKGGLLWSLINTNKVQTLGRYLLLWSGNSQFQPALWSAFAAGFAKLNQPENALPWFKRHALLYPNDYLWLLSYADALTAAHWTDAAWRLRKHVFSKLRSHFDQNKIHSETKFSENALLKRSYVTLKRDFVGVDEELNSLTKIFTKGMQDPIAQELVIGSLLSQENFGAARYWLLQTHAARQQRPAWQLLTLAFADSDLASIEHILETQGNDLTPLNQIESLKRLGKPDDALALVHNLIETNPNQSEINQIHQQHNDLLFERSRHTEFSWNFKSLGVLDIQLSQFKLTIPLGKSKWTVQVGYNQLDSSEHELLLPADNEVDLSIAGSYPLSQGGFNFKAGSNLRDDKSLVYGTMRLSHKFSRILEGGFNLGLNEISYDTAMLRALGAKDKISLDFSAQLTKQLLLQFELEGHRYLTRRGTNLAEGYKVNFTLGNNLLMGDPSWQVRIHGAWESNNLQTHLPSELASSIVSPSASVEDIVTPRYGTLGFGTTFRYGSPEHGFIGRPFVLADVWTGWVWPSNTLAYNARIAAGLSIFGPDVLSLNAFYGNTQGGRTDQAYRGVGIQYEFRF